MNKTQKILSALVCSVPFLAACGEEAKGIPVAVNDSKTTYQTAPQISDNLRAQAANLKIDIVPVCKEGVSNGYKIVLHEVLPQAIDTKDKFNNSYKQPVQQPTVTHLLTVTFGNGKAWSGYASSGGTFAVYDEGLNLDVNAAKLEELRTKRPEVVEWTQNFMAEQLKDAKLGLLLAPVQTSKPLNAPAAKP